MTSCVKLLLGCPIRAIDEVNSPSILWFSAELPKTIDFSPYPAPGYLCSASGSVGIWRTIAGCRPPRPTVRIGTPQGLLSIGAPRKGVNYPGRKLFPFLLSPLICIITVTARAQSTSPKAQGGGSFMVQCPTSTVWHPGSSLLGYDPTSQEGSYTGPQTVSVTVSIIRGVVYGDGKMLPPPCLSVLWHWRAATRYRHGLDSCSVGLPTERLLVWQASGQFD